MKIFGANAIANMITNGEHQIDKVVAKDSGDIEILVDFEKRKTVRLKEIIPDWWGTARFNKNRG